MKLHFVKTLCFGIKRLCGRCMPQCNIIIVNVNTWLCRLLLEVMALIAAVAYLHVCCCLWSPAVRVHPSLAIVCKVSLDWNHDCWCCTTESMCVPQATPLVWSQPAAGKQKITNTFQLENMWSEKLFIYDEYMFCSTFLPKMCPLNSSRTSNIRISIISINSLSFHLKCSGICSNVSRHRNMYHDCDKVKILQT